MQKLRKIVAMMAIVSLVAVNGYVSNVNAASLKDVSVKLSDSDVSVTATSTVTLTINTALATNYHVDVTMSSSGGDANTPTCSAGFTPQVASGKVARCNATGAVATSTVVTITIPSVTNPASVGSYVVSVKSYTSGDALIESATAMIAIVDNIDVSATVASTLTFEIRPLATTTVINGATTTAASATTSLAFGTLQVGTSSIMGQELRVTTNADSGYTVTLEQDQNLTSAGGSDIDAFANGATSTPAAWAAPAGTLDSEATYGHLGFTTDDATGNGSVVQDYTSGKWRGLDSNIAVPVMYHNGPADGGTQDKGMVKVGYRIQISALQEAGDYTSTLTYIATPVY